MFYGIDSDTAVFPTGAASKDFYVGRRGYGTIANSSYWNSTGANLATKRYMYWGIQGPKSDPNFAGSSGRYAGTNGYAWGQLQGQSARTERASSPANMKTIFADVEEGFGGWFTPTEIVNGNNETGADVNYQVFKGFCDKITESVYSSGVYTSNGSWGNIMGSTKSPSYATTVWGANWPSGSTFNSPPSSFANCKKINGVAPTIWQYYGETGAHNASVTGDANIASSLPS